jgi:hypothetical protein
MLLKFKKQFNKTGKMYLKIKIRPSVDSTKVKRILEDGTVKIDIAMPPIKGKANQELIKFLAKEFEVLEKNVKIIRGAKKRVKLLKIVK